MLARAVHRGELIRVRQGWYAVPGTPEELLEAFRVGGALTCMGAGRILGLTVRNSPHLHVAVAAHTSRLRDPRDASRRLDKVGTTVHWTTGVELGSTMRDVVDVLVDMAFCQPAEYTIAAVDSALRLGRINAVQWRTACARMPRRLRRLLSRVDGRAESITESLVRTRLWGLGIQTRVQVRIPGVGRVDLLVGERLVIEVDGFAYHSDPDDFEKDRQRDARLSARGYRVLRFSYRQVTGRWGEVKGSVLAAIARGDHLA